MALVVSSSSQPQTGPDPTAALQAALTNFENVLSSEQRAQYHTQIQRFNQHRPDASSVIQFVAELDAVNHAKTRKSVSPKLCTFLDATLQFTNIVDTFVSSNPDIAALIWGGIKTTILIASNVVSYFDKIANMMVEVGKICPIYRNFSHLYSSSTELQQALCGYYVIVVKLVTKVVEVSQRTGISSLLSTAIFPFESDFRPLQNELKDAARLVELQISLAAKQAAQASARLIELESKENSRHRRFVKSFASELKADQDAARQLRIQESDRKAAKMKLRIKDQLSTINQEIPWKQAQKQRLSTTAEWFRDEPGFQAWIADPRTATLWCPGRMGTGKTVLVANIITRLHTQPEASSMISFHFCRSENSASLVARNIVGTITRQILNKHIDNARESQLQELRNKCQYMDIEGTVDLLLSYLEKDKQYYIIIDGLDECAQDQVVELSRSMTRLHASRNHHLKLLYTGRPELEYQLFDGEKPNYRLPLSGSAINTDIERYIDIALNECLIRNEIKLVNPEVILKIRDTLFAEHGGLILYVRLLIEDICWLGNESAILRALSNPPRKITDMLAARVRRVQEHDLNFDAMKVLRYCGAVKRPLTVDEYSELLSLLVSQTSLDRTKIPQNMDQIITACYGLVYVEEEETTIHYVHHVVKQHLFTDSDSLTEAFVESEIDEDLGQLCLTYLNFNDFRRQLSKTHANSNTSVSPIQIGLNSVQSSSVTVNKIARSLLNIRRSSQLTISELSRRTEDILSEAESSRLKAELQSRPFHLLDYVQNYWIWHCARLEEDSRMWHRFSACVRGENNLAKRPWLQDDDLLQRDKTPSLLSTAWGIHNNNAGLLLHDVLQDPCVLSSSDRLNIMRRAINMKNRHLVLAAVYNRQHELEMIQHGLSYSIRDGCEDYLDLFVDLGADINAAAAATAEEDDGWTAFQVAAREGHLEVVERLIAAKVDVNIITTGHVRRTALEAAAKRGYSTVVERLLAAGAHVNTHPVVRYEKQTVLQAAAEGGHLDILEQLLAAGFDIKIDAECEGQPALQAAAEEGHLEVVEQLIAAQAHVNAARYDGRTALHAAAEGGHLEVVERLIAAKADVDAIANDESTAVQLAAVHGYLQVVDRLISAGAEVNPAPTGNYRQTALQAAAGGGHLEVVERLLAAKADVHAMNSEYGRWTALDFAAKAGHREVVERLKLAGARE